jgi:hypothetical protein
VSGGAGVISYVPYVKVERGTSGKREESHNLTLKLRHYFLTSDYVPSSREQAISGI